MLGCHAYGGRVPNLEQHDGEHFDFVCAEAMAIDLSLTLYRLRRFS